MRSIFLAFLCFLVAFSQLMVFRAEAKTNGGRLPIITWVTAYNPVRVQQIALFRQWLTNHGYPDVEVRLDLNNGGVQKTITQGVAGVAADLIDNSGGLIWFYKEMGIATPINDIEKNYGYPDSERFHSASSEYMSGSNQYAFPCNVSAPGLAINLDALAACGLPAPETAFSMETFEKMATVFTERANKGKPHQDKFFVDDVPIDILRHSMKVSTFNETLTASTLKQEGTIKALKKIYEWVYEKHFMPSVAESQSFAVEAGFGTPAFQLWNKGNFACINTGRWLLIQIRQMKSKPNCSYTTFPYELIPYAPMQSRCIMVYKGTAHLDAAKSFVAYLRSPEYNKSIVESLDSLPPSPKYMDSEEFLHPVGYSNEWKLHAGTKEVALKYGYGKEYSPYCLMVNYNKQENKIWQGYMSKVIKAEEAVNAMDTALNQEIKDFVSRHTDIQDQFQKAKERQVVIEGYKKRGEKIPADLIDNVYLRKLYLEDGRAI